MMNQAIKTALIKTHGMNHKAKVLAILNVMADHTDLEKIATWRQMYYREKEKVARLEKKLKKNNCS